MHWRFLFVTLPIDWWILSSERNRGRFSQINEKNNEMNSHNFNWYMYISIELVFKCTPFQQTLSHTKDLNIWNFIAVCVCEKCHRNYYSYLWILWTFYVKWQCNILIFLQKKWYRHYLAGVWLNGKQKQSKKKWTDIYLGSVYMETLTHTYTWICVCTTLQKKKNIRFTQNEMSCPKWQIS